MILTLPMNLSSRALNTITSEKPLSGDDAVQLILADIPLFAVGLLAFGMFIFFLAMRRINGMVLCLHSAVFLAFIGGILDLSQILLRTGGNVTPQTHITGLTTAREICFALSSGLRFAFFWFFVAEPPSGVNKSTRGEMHSGSWGKWGIFGILLQWVLALFCVAISLLQILYRTINSFETFGPVYEVESTLEIVASACFILKLLLNLYLAFVTDAPGKLRWISFVGYVPVILALFINIAVGAGNMIQFLFSESIIGRLLQAVEYYILIVTISVCTFYHLRNASRSPLPVLRINRSSSFRGLGRMTQSSFRISHPPFSSSSQAHGAPPGEKTLKIHNPNGSVAARLSSWLVPYGMSQRSALHSPSSPTGDKLWNQSEAERGVSPSLYSTASVMDADMKISQTSFDESPSEPKESAKWQDPLYNAILSASSPGEALANAALRPPVGTLTIPPRALSSPSSSNADSPIYGLNGRQALYQEQSLHSLPLKQDTLRSPQDNPDTRRSSSFSQILRQQAELDKSIASLRLLSRDDSKNLVDDGKPSSASQSEFSLSNFPAPPWSRSSTDTDYTVRPGLTPLVTVSRADSVKSQRPEHLDLLPPKMPAVMEHIRNVSVPFSDNDDPLPTGRTRVDSEGTQYEITSFIGHLTHKKGESTGTSVTNSSGGSPPRGRLLANTPGELASSVDFPLPPHATASPPRRAASSRAMGLPSRPKLAVGGTLSPLAEKSSLRDDFESPRPAPSPA